MRRLGNVLLGDTTGPHGGSERFAAAALWIALMTFLACTAVALSMPVLYGADERAHLAYVERLGAGELPTVDTPVDTEGAFTVLARYYGADGAADSGPHGTVWVANHPPLAYVIALPPALALSALGLDLGAALSLRLLSAAGMAVGALASVAVAGALLPGRRSLALLAGAVVGLSPMVLAIGGLGQNDGVAFAVATSLLAVVLRVLRTGSTARRLGPMVGLATAAALTRASLLPLVAVAAVVWVVVGRARLRPALGGAAAIVGVPLLLAGWFYVRNVRLYGGFTGSGYLQDKFDRSPGGSTASILLGPTFLVGIWQEMWGNFRDTARIGSGGIYIGSSRPVLGSSLVAGGLLAAAALAGGARTLLAGPLRWSRRGAAVWLVALGWAGVTVAAVASFASGGGTPHPRYLLPVHAVTALVLAAGVAALLGVHRAWPVLVGGLGLVDLLLVGRLYTAVEAYPGRAGLELPGWTTALVVAALVGAAAAAGRALTMAERCEAPAFEPVLVPA